MALRPYLRLARVPAAGFTASVVLWGYVAARHEGLAPFMPGDERPIIPLLLFAGVFAHVFGCVHNEICDRDLDARPGYVRAKPLPAGQISVVNAKLFAGGALAAGLLCAFEVARLTGYPEVLSLTAAAAAAAAAYNRYGKRVLGGEFLFSASMALFTLAGAAAVAGFSSALAGAPLWFVILAFLTLSFNVLFAGGVKDMETDAEAGLRTVVGRLRRAGDRGASPLRFVATAGYALQFLILAAAAYALLFVIEPLGAQGLLPLQLSAVVVVIAIRALLFGRALKTSTRRHRVRLLSVNEALQVPLFVVLLLGSMTTEWVALLILMPIAAAIVLNATVYGTLAAPDV